MRLGLLALVALALAMPAAANANIVPPNCHGTTEEYFCPAQGPSPEQMQIVERIAVEYWKGTPACGMPGVNIGNVGNIGGEAVFADCVIDLPLGLPLPTFCRDYVHEFGHLLLGPTYFAAVNPSEPQHSPDPANIMYGHSISVAQEEAQERAVNCLSPPRVSDQQVQAASAGARVAKHHRRRRKWRWHG